MGEPVVPEFIELDDPRPIAAEAPYTFELPLSAWLDALQPGDLVKAIFRQTDGAELEYRAERMWVEIEQIDGDLYTGPLVNQPSSITRIAIGDIVSIPRSHVIATEIAEGRTRPCPDDRREYRDRCLVDACVVDGRSHVEYLYREKSEGTKPGDEFPDSGWRIRGTRQAIDHDERQGKTVQYLALGVVLNRDDNWLHLIDSPPGSYFAWDAESARYVALDG